MIRDVGFDPVDAGPRRIARYIEPFCLLVSQLAYGEKVEQNCVLVRAVWGIRISELLPGKTVAAQFVSDSACLGIWRATESSSEKENFCYNYN